MTSRCENGISYPYYGGVDLRPMDRSILSRLAQLETLPEEELQDAATAMLTHRVDDNFKKLAQGVAEHKKLPPVDLARQFVEKGNVYWLRPTLALVPAEEMSLADKISLLGDGFDNLASASSDQEAAAYNLLARYCWNIERALRPYLNKP